MDVRKHRKQCAVFGETEDSGSKGGDTGRGKETFLGRALSLRTFYTEFSMHDLLKPSLPPRGAGNQSTAQGWIIARGGADPGGGHKLQPLDIHFLHHLLHSAGSAAQEA